MGMTGTATEAEVGQAPNHKLMDDLKAVVADAEELLKATATQTGERIAAARASTEQSLKAARARLTAAQAAVVGETKVVAKAADDYVRANPWEAVGIAAAIGLVLGILVTRR